MALWKDNQKILFIGTSGLQYKPELQSTRSVEELNAIVRKFYERKRAVLVEDEGKSELLFVRGSKIIGRLSCLLFLSEKWAYQQIKVSISDREGHRVVSLSYDAWMYFTVIGPPNAFEKEVRALRTELCSKV